jgi:hypothetical protein
MEKLGMSWGDIKSIPRNELEGLLRALNIYNTIHAFDGYSSKDIEQMAKDKPNIRSNYNESMAMKEKYEILIGAQRVKKVQKLSDLLG